MNNKTRKIIVLNNLDSSKIEQAIFILRDNTAISTGIDAVEEAERIVNSYLNDMNRPILSQKKAKRPPVLFFASCILCTVISLFIAVLVNTLK